MDSFWENIISVIAETSPIEFIVLVLSMLAAWYLWLNFQKERKAIKEDKTGDSPRAQTRKNIDVIVENSFDAKTELKEIKDAIEGKSGLEDRTKEILEKQYALMEVVNKLVDQHNDFDGATGKETWKLAPETLHDLRRMTGTLMSLCEKVDSIKNEIERQRP